MSRLFLLLLGSLFLAGCKYREVHRETGYKGKARVNPWLAAERLIARYDYPVRSLVSWEEPSSEDAVWFVPGPVLGNTGFIRQVDGWVNNGGHLVILLENAETERNDWRDPVSRFSPEPALETFLQEAGIAFTEQKDAAAGGGSVRISFAGAEFHVDAGSSGKVSSNDEAPGVFTSVGRGDGRVSVLTDARLFRNRWIGEKQHASLLVALVEATGYTGPVVFLRGSGISLWGLMVEHLWPVLIALGVLTLLWLWKNFSRFGPIEAAGGPSPLRGFEHHLEALGDYQWRLDRAAALVAPLRDQIVELGQRSSTRSGRRDDDFFQFLADRSGIPRERVFRALAEAAPADAAILTRTTADLQRLLQVLH